MKKIILSVAVIATVALTSCGDNSWSDANKEKFVKDCAAEGAPEATCKCMVDKLAEKYDDVSSAKKAMEDDKNAAMELVKECM